MKNHMTQADIEEGGFFFEVRCLLEEIAEELGADSFEVKPAEFHIGPLCFLSRKGIKANLWWDEDTGMLVLREVDGDKKRVLFYQDESTPEIWDRLSRSPL